ncbi:NF-kappa-B inhibitor delta [Podarcis lilfordi]|uniref:NF-kappa-B inhibitor delta n=1 Tax=Podarcis lilfordi TaxID=74358 RepID=A0AA35PA26_9SAUR|nr:NF-kappa-B inhibitor delta [Podarcis lilfordi]
MATISAFEHHLLWKISLVRREGKPQVTEMRGRGCKVPRSSLAPQTVRELLEQKRQQQMVLGHSTGPQIPPGVFEANRTEPPRAAEGRGPTPGQTAAPEYPVAAFPTWQPDTSSQAAFPADCHYQPVDPTKNYLLPHPGPQYGIINPFTSLDASVYGPAGPSTTEAVYGSKMASAVDYETAVSETGPLDLFPAPGGVCLQQEMNNPCLLPEENFPASSMEVDPGELTQARAEIRNTELPLLLHQDEDGDTFLHLYVAKGHRPLAYATAEVFRECGQLDVKEHRGKTPLLVAAAANQPGIVKDLIILGADVNAADQKGQTVLHLGATYGLPSVIEAVMVTGIPVNVDARNFEGLTPLHCAVIAHNAAFQSQSMDPLSQQQLQNFLLCIRLLLELGANYKSQELKSSKTILHLAVQAANLPLIQFLLQLPEGELQNFVNMKAHGNTALHMAAGLHGHPFQEQIVRLLLHHWADPSARNLENEQPVHLLAPGPATEQLRLLLRSRRLGPGPAHLPPFP